VGDWSTVFKIRALDTGQQNGSVSRRDGLTSVSLPARDALKPY
jgi:hypothetical protein